MNDRFKFRVWDNINSKWLDKRTLDIESGFITGFYDDEQAFKRRYTLMQSTGLKDKNGTLIYEGDILRLKDIKIPVEVRFKGIGFELYAEAYYVAGYLNNKYIPEYSEVIGNIYENANLLEDT